MTDGVATSFGGLFKVGETITTASAVNTLQYRCYKAARDAGWWDAERHPFTFSNKLMLTVSELAEAMEADRKGLKDDKLPHRDGREVELADALIRICDLAGAYGFDLGGAVEEKMAYNLSRQDHTREHRAAFGGKAY